MKKVTRTQDCPVTFFYDTFYDTARVMCFPPCGGQGPVVEQRAAWPALPCCWIEKPLSPGGDSGRGHSSFIYGFDQYDQGLSLGGRESLPALIQFQLIICHIFILWSAVIKEIGQCNAQACADFFNWSNRRLQLFSKPGGNRWLGDAWIFGQRVFGPVPAQSFSFNLPQNIKVWFFVGHSISPSENRNRNNAASPDCVMNMAKQHSGAGIMFFRVQRTHGIQLFNWRCSIYSMKIILDI